MEMPCVINTINGDAKRFRFFKEITAAGIKSDTCPIVILSVLSEDEFSAHCLRKDLVGHLGCWDLLHVSGTRQRTRSLPATSRPGLLPRATQASRRRTASHAADGPVL